jgi:hypothetical protein
MNAPQAERLGVERQRRVQVGHRDADVVDGLQADGRQRAGGWCIGHPASLA